MLAQTGVLATFICLCLAGKYQLGVVIRAFSPASFTPEENVMEILEAVGYYLPE